MQHPYDVLVKENAALLAGAYVLHGRHAEAIEVADRLLKNHSRYEEVQSITSVPVIVGSAIHERECGGDFRCALCNGERIIGTDRRTTLVPRGHGPYATFVDGAKDAFHIDGLDVVEASHGWTQESACYYWEAYNGFGPRAHGRHTGYVWAGTNVYDGGKYVADGQWDPSAQDQQLGCVAIMMAIVQLAPEFALPRAEPTIMAHTVVPLPQAVPEGHGTADMGAAEVQTILNRLGCNPPLSVDGSFGRVTTRAVKSFQRWKGLEADGLVGPVTRQALRAATT